MEKTETWHKQVVFPYKVAFSSQLLDNMDLLPFFSLLHLFVSLSPFSLCLTIWMINGSLLLLTKEWMEREPKDNIPPSQINDHFRHFSREAQVPSACQVYFWLITLKDVLPTCYSVFKEHYESLSEHFSWIFRYTQGSLLYAEVNAVLISPGFRKSWGTYLILYQQANFWDYSSS